MAAVAGRLARFTPGRWLWWPVFVVAVGLTLHAGMLGLYRSGIAGDDFAQFFVFARALLDRVDPYLPLGQLTARYAVPGWQDYAFATPYPPTVGVLFLPFTLVPFGAAATVWLWFELVCVALAAVLLLRGAQKSLSVVSVAAVTGVLLGLDAFSQDLHAGNMMVLLLALLAGGRLALLSNRPGLGGALVGLAILAKPVPWPLLLLFVVRRQWRALGSACGVLLAGYIAALVVGGPAPLLEYFLQVLPANNGQQAGSNWNLSLWTIGTRLFVGTRGASDSDIAALPLGPDPAQSLGHAVTLPFGHGLVLPFGLAVALPFGHDVGLPFGLAGSLPFGLDVSAAAVLGLLLPAVVLVAACIWARREPDADRAFGVMTGVLVLVSPVAWDLYFVLAAIPASQLLERVCARGTKPRRWLWALLLIPLGLVPVGGWWKIAQVLDGHSWSRDATWGALPFGIALLVLAPSALLATLCWRLATDPALPPRVPPAARQLPSIPPRALVEENSSPRQGRT